jgi:hypothetical protein
LFDGEAVELLDPGVLGFLTFDVEDVNQRCDQKRTTGV